MDFSNLIIQNEDKIAVLTINRPDQLNALNIKTIDELSAALDELQNDKNVQVIIITGSGEKAFVAGADIKEFYQFDVEKGKQLSRDGHVKLFNKIENLDKPVIAAVNGFALGGGLELAMACHIRLASHGAKMGLPEVSLGVIPGYGGTQRLAHLAGKGKAMEMIMTAQMISAEEAMECGLVNDVTTQGELVEKCREIARKIIKNSPIAVGGAIRAVNAGYQDGVDGFEREIEEFGKCFGTGDFKEGTTAFVEKRKPEFPGA
jgi:enoyl-CoA hydratase